MNFKFDSITIRDLIALIDNDRIDLKPYYQRNDIWSRNDQESLISSIISNFPLPNFFICRNKKGLLEMVDGQQRARTIYRYANGAISDSSGKMIGEIKSENFFNYKLSVTEIYDILENKEIEQFYVLVNKKGKQLNTPEIHKAEYAGSNYLKLTEDLLEVQSFMNLNLFTDATSKRMNDRNFIEELIAYLLHGIQDKKKIIESIYEKDITEEEAVNVKEKFIRIIEELEKLNQYYPIKKTRYRQKNDFYTYFNFINENINQTNDLFLLQYKILLKIEDFISPTNEECKPFREYALNCVSQSNSKYARTKRLDFFKLILRNTEKELEYNNQLAEITNYLDKELPNVDFIEYENLYLINPNI